jgi:hypothetical protein
LELEFRIMSRLFESFEFLDRGWDIRLLENTSLRKVFLMMLASLFVLGWGTGWMLSDFIHFHRFSWGGIFDVTTLTFFGIRYARIIYRRLPTST